MTVPPGNPQQPYGRQPPPYGQHTPGAGYPQPGGYPPQGGYPQHGGYPQPPRKKKVWPWVLGGILVVLLLVVGGCVALVGTVANEIENEVSREVTVSYQAGGTGTSTVTYSDGNLDVAQESDVALPWSKDVTVTGLVKFVSLSVLSGADGGNVSCKITVGGKVIAEDQASGQFASAICSGDAAE
ncbi:MmpS family transport accessory protein [Nocardia sp. NPDC058633]|uniref:MmpS family transport accessory protein n=1 Tax=Nocardia sp. NPDC058633 TaxID=3346568 RepID=UPI00365E209B